MRVGGIAARLTTALTCCCSVCLPACVRPALQEDSGSEEVLDAVLGGRPLLCLGEAEADLSCCGGTLAVVRLHC